MSGRGRDRDAIEVGKTQTPKNIRSLLAKLGFNLKKEGLSEEKILSVFSDAGVPVCVHTYRKWMTLMAKQGSIYGDRMVGGSSCTLSKAEQRVLVGWVVDSNRKGEKVTGESTVRFIKDAFDRNVSTSTVSNYYKKLGITSQLTRTMGAGYSPSIDSLVGIAFNWIRSSAFPKERSKLCSIDFLSLPATHSASCILQCTWADGIDRTPALLFTYSSIAGVDESVVKRNEVIMAEYTVACRKYGVDEMRVLHVDNSAQRDQESMGEKDMFVRLFLEHYNVSKDTTILTNGGIPSKLFSEKLFQELGYGEHLECPSPVHQYLSPNIGVVEPARAAWQSVERDPSDSVEAVVALLQCIDNSSDKGKELFDYYLQVSRKYPDKEQVRVLFSCARLETSTYLQECFEEYREYMGEEDSEEN